VIFHTVCNSIVIAKVKFGQIAVQVLFAAVLVHALHAALEDREAALDYILLRLVTKIFLGAVAHGLMARELAANMHILARLVRHDAGFAGYVFAHDRHDGFRLAVIGHERAGLALAANEG
jgi:hypothetical protein